MAWNTIYDYLIRHLAAVNTTLVGYIRNDLNHLAQTGHLYSADRNAIDAAIASSSWTVVKDGIMYVPAQVKNIQVRCAPGFNDTVASREADVRIANGAGGWNSSGSFTPNGGGTYNIKTATVPSAGSFSGAGAWLEFQVRLYHTEGVPKAGYVRDVVFNIGEIVS